MKRPDYRTLQALDAVIRERGFERAAQKLCITQSAVSQRIKQLENMFGQPLLVRTVPPRPTEQGQKLLALLRQVELLEEEWLGDEQTGSTPLLLSLAVNADSLATWLLPALSNVLSDSPIRLNLQVEDETRTQERLRRGEVVGAVSIQPQALPSCLVDQLGALDYLFVASKEFAQRYFPNGVTRSALLKAPVVAFDHLDDRSASQSQGTHLLHELCTEFGCLLDGFLPDLNHRSNESTQSVLRFQKACSFELAINLGHGVGSQRQLFRESSDRWHLLSRWKLHRHYLVNNLPLQLSRRRLGRHTPDGP